MTKIHLKWTVDKKPTGRYSSFGKRGWPNAEFKGTDFMAAMLSCPDEYIPANVKTGNHREITIRVCLYKTNGHWNATNLKAKAKTLSEAKELVLHFWQMTKHEEYLPDLLKPMVGETVKPRGRETPICIIHASGNTVFAESGPIGYGVVGNEQAVCFAIDIICQNIHIESCGLTNDSLPCLTLQSEHDMNNENPRKILVRRFCKIAFPEFTGWRVHAAMGGDRLTVALVKA